MLEQQKNPITDQRTTPKPSIWHAVLTSIFGAANRLHQYRDAHDVLLRKVLQEQEACYREELCCDE